MPASEDTGGQAARGTRRWPREPRTFPAFLAAILIASAALGQASAPAPLEPASTPPDADESLDELQDIELLTMEVPVVISTGRREQKASLAPYAVSVITAEDIRRSGARSVPDALRLVPGVDVAELGYANAAVSPRGLHSFFTNQTLILVDGRQIHDSLYGGALWAAWPFQLEDIEQIEVVRGPGGVAWGANTNNGVINIITKDPVDQLGLTATGMGGSRGSQKEHLGYSFTEGKLRMRVSGEYEGSDGFKLGGLPFWSTADDYKAGRSDVHAIYEATPDDAITLSGGNSTVDGVTSLPIATGIGIYKNAGSQSSYLMSKWRHRIGEENSFSLTAFINDHGAWPGPKFLDYRYQQLALQFSHTFRAGDNHVITWGLDNRVDLVDTSNADPFMLTEDFVSTDVTGIYFQDEWNFAPKWTLTLGGRWDYDSYGGFQPSGRAALSYELAKDSLVYAAVSRAFSMPPGAMRFSNIPQSNGLVRVTADRGLDAMSLIAYELGYRTRLFDRLQLSADLYAHHNDDVRAIVTRLGPPGLLNANLENSGDLWLYGAELDARYALTERLTLLANYTFQQCEANLDLPFRYTDFISPPKNKLMGGVRYDVTDDLHLSAHAYYVDPVSVLNADNLFFDRRIPSYLRVDLRAEQEFWDDRASLAVGVRNLLDPHHPEGGTLLLNHTEVPRMVYAEIRMSFR